MGHWVRLWDDMPTDPKWRVVARRAGRSLPEVMAVFVFMMTNAGGAVERGCLDNWNDEDVAAALDMEPEHVAAIRQAMEGKTIEGGKLTGWDRRQPKREDSGSTKRVQEYRERLAEETKRDETQCNAPEKRREDADKSNSLLSARMTESDFRKAIMDAYREVGSTKFPDTGRAALWIAQGFDPAICIAALRSRLPKMPDASLNYFDGAVADAHKVPRGTAKSTGPPRAGKRDPFLKNLQDKIQRASHERDSDPTILDGAIVAGEGPTGGGVHAVRSGAGGPRLADTG